MKRQWSDGLYLGMQQPDAIRSLHDIVVARLPDATVVDGTSGLEVTYGGWTAYVHRHQYRGDDALVIFGKIGEEALAPPRAVLELSSQLGSGGIGLFGCTYVVRVAIPMARLEQASLGDSIQYVASLAARLARQLNRLRPDLSSFASSYGGY